MKKIGTPKRTTKPEPRAKSPQIAPVEMTRPAGNIRAALDPVLAALSQEQRDVLARCNAMSPAEIIEVIPHPRLKRAVRWIAASLGLQVVDGDGPEWARCAAAEFGKCLTPPKSKRAASDEYQIGWRIGHVFRFLPEVQQIEPSVKELCELIQKMRPVLQTIASQQPPAKAADYFTGLADGEKSTERITQLTQRAKLFFLIACAPQEVEAFKSTSELPTVGCQSSSGVEQRTHKLKRAKSRNFIPCHPSYC